jgi:2-polyprenyl-3-methyl-5-hydroxy-6-metoxy-1,4-benzoquinol methylase
VVSFRDPSGSVIRTESQIFRCVSGSAFRTLEEFLASPPAQSFLAAGKLVSTSTGVEEGDGLHAVRACSALEFDAGVQVVEHERVWFPSYPYEWPPEMLFAAGELTLELAQASLKQGFGLKDATPYNVLFRGPRPVFVDVLSFEKRDAADPAWLPYAQFVRTFVLPLLMNRRFGMRTDETFLSHADGLTPEEVYRYCTWPQRLRPPFLTTVSLPAWLGKRATNDDGKLYTPKRSGNPEKAQFILESQLRHLGRLLRSVRPRKTDSVWSSYTETLSYADEEFTRKSGIVADWTYEVAPRAVLDLGCNTGHFSEIAARAGAQVVATDLDPVVVGETWRRAAASHLDILPLVVNAARPTPPVGWRNAEYSSFLERATGQFDLVLMLALLHHLLVTERIPLAEILNIASELTKSYAIVEFVSKDDPLFRRLTRGREALHETFTQEAFEATCQQRFYLIDKQPVKGNLRWLYLLRKRNS